MQNEVTTEEIEEVGLAFLYLTCRKIQLITGKKSTKKIVGSFLQNWKNINFEVLDALLEKELVDFALKDKTLVITKEGEIKAKEIIKKLLGKDFEVETIEEIRIGK